MTPQEIAHKYARMKLGGAEAALVLALLFGPKSKAVLWKELPHHRDTLADALKKLVERGDVILRPGPHTQLALAASRSLAHGENAARTSPAGRDPAVKTEKTPRDALLDRPAWQIHEVCKSLRVDWNTVEASPAIARRAEELARRRFGPA